MTESAIRWRGKSTPMRATLVSCGFSGTPVHVLAGHAVAIPRGMTAEGIGRIHIRSSSLALSGRIAVVPRDEFPYNLAVR